MWTVCFPVLGSNERALSEKATKVKNMPKTKITLFILKLFVKDDWATGLMINLYVCISKSVN